MAAGEQRVTRLERATFSWEGCTHRMQPAQPQEPTIAETNACTNACTSGAKVEHDRPAEAAPEAVAGAVSAADADGAGEHFAAALAMIARLPLTDAEKAEAVRRLLAVGR